MTYNSHKPKQRNAEIPATESRQTGRIPDREARMYDKSLETICSITVGGIKFTVPSPEPTYVHFFRFLDRAGFLKQYKK